MLIKLDIIIQTLLAGVIAELPYRKEMETHELSWLSWLAVTLLDACARRRWRSRAGFSSL